MQPTVWVVNLKNGLAALFFAKNGGFTMAAKKKIINIRVYFDGDQVWPPKFSSRSEQLCTALYTSNPETERAEPVAMFSERVNTTAGR